jgi:3-oxoacyl-[acyl-carrier protein] reductase
VIQVDLSNKNVLVTGGTRGIGSAITRLFAQAGANTAAVYHANEEAAITSLQERRAFGTGTHQNYRADLGDAASIVTLAQQVRLGIPDHLDILIHNAGIGVRGSVENITLGQWQQSLENNFTAVFHLTQALIPVIPAGGSIVTIGSSIIAHPLPNMAAYGAGKAASAYFTQILAQELGPRGIRANIVSPGSIATEFGGPGSEAFKQQIVSRTALRRIGQPEDVATVVVFLSSDLARFISGQNIFVDGGVV